MFVSGGWIKAGHVTVMADRKLMQLAASQRSDGREL
jgi:hypothetical protein